MFAELEYQLSATLHSAPRFLEGVGKYIGKFGRRTYYPRLMLTACDIDDSSSTNRSALALSQILAHADTRT